MNGLANLRRTSSSSRTWIPSISRIIFDGFAGLIMLIVSGGEETSENLARIETGDVAATCSSKVLECDPGRT